jgi:hypothetical protein
LVTPLAVRLMGTKPDWDVLSVLAGDATKSRLGRLIGGDETPCLLFTSSMSMSFEPSDPRQPLHQGAIICQDWPGPARGAGKPIGPELYFAADDVSDSAQVRGMVIFFLSCYSAGVPRWDEYSDYNPVSDRKQIAPRPYISHLPRRLLGHPRGGALAVIGRVERCWSYSYSESGARSNLGTFENSLRRLLERAPVGFAMDFFSRRYTELAAEYSGLLQEAQAGDSSKVDDYALAGLKTMLNDAKNFIVIGDPAVRIVPGDADNGWADGERVSHSRTDRPLAPTDLGRGPEPARDDSGIVSS